MILPEKTHLMKIDEDKSTSSSKNDHMIATEIKFSHDICEFFIDNDSSLERGFIFKRKEEEVMENITQNYFIKLQHVKQSNIISLS